MEELLERLVNFVRGSGLSISTAESCTGGLIGHLITNIPGSSEYYKGGIIAYANSAKIVALGVDSNLIEESGAVSEGVAAAMAKAIRQRFHTDIGISTTGVAGPGCGSPEKPVGLVYIGLATQKQVRVEACHWPFDRLGNKEASARKALEMVIDPRSYPDKC